MSNVWVPDDTDGWCQGTPDASGLTFKKDNGQSLTVKSAAEAGKFEDVKPSHTAGYGQIIK